MHSYTQVHHAIQPAFKPFVPYVILLVDLDTQKGKPTEHEALRIVGNLTTADGASWLRRSSFSRSASGRACAWFFAISRRD